MGKNILKATSAVAAVMLLSKVLGFLRQSIVANVYGSNTATDIYFVSSEFMINLSAAFTTALTTALVTVYISIALNQGKPAAGKVASRVLSLFLMGAAVVVVLLDLFAPKWAGCWPRPIPRNRLQAWRIICGCSRWPFFFGDSVCLCGSTECQ